MKEDHLLNIPKDKNLLNVDAQKELIDYTFKKSTQYMLKIFLVVFPLILLFIFGVYYIVFTFAVR